MFGKPMVMLVAIIGLLLLVIGVGAHHPNVILAGDFLFIVGLIGGSMAKEEESVALKVAMFSVGGLFAIAAFASSSILSGLLTGR
jgi:hypothetical protein